MDYRVIKDFVDKNTLSEFKAGDNYACPDTERADSLILMGYLAANETVKQDDPEQKAAESEDKTKENAAESQQEKSVKAEPKEKPQKAAKSVSKKSVKNKKA